MSEEFKVGQIIWLKGGNYPHDQATIEAIGILDAEAADEWFLVGCYGCDMSGPQKSTRLEAVRAWNSIEMRIAEEREACAQLADLAAQQCGEGFGGMVLANGIAVAIRKRGQP